MKLLHLLFVTVSRKVRECYLSPNKFHTDLTKKAWGTRKTSFYEKIKTAKRRWTFTKGNSRTVSED